MQWAMAVQIRQLVDPGKGRRHPCCPPREDLRSESASGHSRTGRISLRNVQDLHRAIKAYHGEAVVKHHRYRSWEHCYGYFQSTGPSGLAADRDHAALQLAFYLASWGMYRGSTFLLQHDYTVHLGVVDVISKERFSNLWYQDIGAEGVEAPHEAIMDLIGEIRGVYRPFAPGGTSTQPTDTLISKVILGTLACLPACDRYFVDGFKLKGLKFARLDEAFLHDVHSFCEMHLDALRREQHRISRDSTVTYPLIKLVDMYFWQIGFEKSTGGGLA